MALGDTLENPQQKIVDPLPGSGFADRNVVDSILA